MVNQSKFISRGRNFIWRQLTDALTCDPENRDWTPTGFWGRCQRLSH